MLFVLPDMIDGVFKNTEGCRVISLFPPRWSLLSAGRFPSASFSIEVRPALSSIMLLSRFKPLETRHFKVNISL